MTTIGILISGRGSNMQSLVAGCESGRIPGRVGLVLSNREKAPGLLWARDRGLETACLSHRDHDGRESHDRAVIERLEGAGVEWVCLAGYMRLLSPHFVEVYRDRIVNIHPSLLPSFPGLHAQRQALEHGVRVTGCTVHLVDADLDHGPIVAQRAVAVFPGDSEESLSARILEQEHRLYVEALADLLARSWQLDGRRLVWGDPFPDRNTSC